MPGLLGNQAMRANSSRSYRVVVRPLTASSSWRQTHMPAEPGTTIRNSDQPLNASHQTLSRLANA